MFEGLRHLTIFKSRLVVLGVACWVAAALVLTASAQPAALDVQGVYTRAAPSVGVVRAIADGRTGIGTAFVVDPDGWLLTAAHVARRAERLEVVLPGFQPLAARAVGYDARRDIAVLRVTPPSPLPALEIAGAALRPGEPVVVIGTPRGRPGVMSTGEVSAVAVTLPGMARDILIRLTARVAPGNSGGPVLSARGQVVGLVIARAMEGGPNRPDAGGGLAVSGGTLLSALPALRAGARIDRAWIGVAGGSLTPEIVRERSIGAQRGAWVREVVPNSPAAGVGLRPNDVIVAADGRAITAWNDLLAFVGDREPGRAIRLTVVRGGGRVEVSLRLGVRP
jgi:S1-C subfamily serine protease